MYCSDGVIKEWEIGTMTCVRRLYDHADAINCTRVSKIGVVCFLFACTLYWMVKRKSHIYASILTFLLTLMIAKEMEQLLRYLVGSGDSNFAEKWSGAGSKIIRCMIL